MLFRDAMNKLEVRVDNIVCSTYIRGVKGEIQLGIIGVSLNTAELTGSQDISRIDNK